MNEKNETDKLQRLIDRCDKCDLAECINCEISWTEVQALKGLLDQYNNLKEIEKEHRKENGELRVELEKEKEKNENLSCNRILIQENVYKEIKEKIENINNYINKNKLFELLEIDNIDVIHCRLKQILEE